MPCEEIGACESTTCRTFSSHRRCVSKVFFSFGVLGKWRFLTHFILEIWTEGKGLKSVTSDVKISAVTNPVCCFTFFMCVFFFSSSLLCFFCVLNLLCSKVWRQDTFTVNMLFFKNPETTIKRCRRHRDTIFNAKQKQEIICDKSAPSHTYFHLTPLTWSEQPLPNHQVSFFNPGSQNSHLSHWNKHTLSCYSFLQQLQLKIFGCSPWHSNILIDRVSRLK